MTRWLAIGTMALLAASPAPAVAQDAKGMAMGMGKGKGAGKGMAAKPAAKAAKGPPAKLEQLACKLGTEDNHARIAVELANGKVREFAYYSIWKPRTCSLHVVRGDAYSKWEEFKAVTTVTLAEEKGAVLIDHSPGKYKFLFRDIDRMRYCGAEGKVSGTLTIWRGKAACELEGVLDDDPTKPVEPVRATQPAEPQPPKEAAPAGAPSKPVEPVRATQPAEPQPPKEAAPAGTNPDQTQEPAQSK